SATSHTAPTSPTVPDLDPDEYQRAKRKLKKAVLEHYRGLETLENYRILNLTGFRKALKKFEKVTHIPAQKLYMSEKVDTTALSTDVSLRDMMEEMDDLFAVQFTNGDKKSARAQLRQMSGHTTHHYSTFRSGLLLGLAVPALVSGLYQSFQHETREAISGWPALLCVYGILTVPTVFSLLIGLNLVTWARTRINYVFIFELDLRTCVDYREYFEMPSLFVATLCYAFYLSFARIGASHVSPTTWPLVWMGLIALVMFNPLPAFYQPSRFWLTKSIAKLFISGTRRVEFTDFWMGDQFCSLIYVLSNIYFIPCVYVKGFDNYQQCGASSPHWPAQFVIAVLPLVIRLVQSVKRYLDSHLITHLINGGKYGSGIIAYLFYFLWRHHGKISWTFRHLCDYLMDWSVLHVRSEHPLLRDELLYTNHIPMYYFALVTNVVIRFLWIFYLPDIGPSMHLRTFIVAMAEMLRRWQWNFYRLENEHLGNMDQYRVTREVPLPYSLDDVRHNRDDDEVE
ncbi:EXS-domain-containing protein, partial [Fistulina hepatica ATCC 64428]